MANRCQVVEPRLILRRFRDFEAESVVRYRSDSAVARCQSWDTPFPVGAARAFDLLLGMVAEDWRR